MEEGRPPPTASPTQEIAKVFNEETGKEEPRKIEVTQDLKDACKLLGSEATGWLKTLQGEALPSRKPLQQPQEIVEGLLK